MQGEYQEVAVREGLHWKHPDQVFANKHLLPSKDVSLELLLVLDHVSVPEMISLGDFDVQDIFVPW